MKTNLRHLHLILACVFLIGCTTHIESYKFDIDHQILKSFKSNIPLRVAVPKNAEKNYLIEFMGKKSRAGDVYVDLNVLYKNTEELIEEVLVKNKIQLSADSEKFIRFTIYKIQWEYWAGGYEVGAYLDFDIETGDGYKKRYRVEDSSLTYVSRAVGRTISRAVEKIFQDEKIIAYIGSL